MSGFIEFISGYVFWHQTGEFLRPEEGTYSVALFFYPLDVTVAAAFVA